VYQRILAVQLSDIGNVVLTTPALAALRETYPTAQIDLLTTPHAAPIVEHTGLITRTLCFDKAVFDSGKALLKPQNLRKLAALTRELRRGRYEVILFFHHLTTRFGALKYAGLSLASGIPQRVGLDNGRGWFLTHRVSDRGFGAYHEAEYGLALAEAIGAQGATPRLWVGMSDADRAWATDHLPADRRWVAIHAGGGTFNVARRWSPEKFASLADRLIDQDSGVGVVLVGGRGDQHEAVRSKMRHGPLILAEKTTLGQLAAVLARCESFYGTDSGVMHIATAAGTPSITALFGATNAQAWRPWRPSAPQTIRVIQSDSRCSPCGYVDHALGLKNGCSAVTCMKVIPEVHVRDPQSLPNSQQRGRSTPLKPIHLLGIPIHPVTFSGLLDQIEEWIKGDTPRQICTVNPEFLMIAQTDTNFRTVLTHADLCAPDGVGVLWAARRIGQPLPERVTGSDGVPLIAERAAQKGWQLFLLGAAPGVGELAGKRLQERYPGLQIVGTFSGSPRAEDEDALVERINASGADILFVAYGAPAQDHWIARNLPRLTPRINMAVGGAFDFIAGVTLRAPQWMRKLGLEWLHRLIKQPWRWRRMLRLPLFVWAVLRKH
jgi:exopolysaccharide biosynthesis WecB/TagA/CpsF family protein